jgi:hypothetical protein
VLNSAAQQRFIAALFPFQAACYILKQQTCLPHACLCLQCVLHCQDLVLHLSQLFAIPEVATTCCKVAAAWQPLAQEWRKLTMAARGEQQLPACLQAFEGAAELEAALEQVGSGHL